MNNIPIIIALTAATIGFSLSSQAADTAKKSSATNSSATTTQSPVPIPPVGAKEGNTVNPPVNASMGEVDPKYKSGGSK